MTTDKTTMIRKLTLLLMVAGAFTLFASSARAMCAYNDTAQTINVEFDCGWFCDNAWTVEAGSHYCRTSESGHFFADFHTGVEGLVLPRINLRVDAHGYVVMSPVGEGVQVCAYRQDNTVSECQTFDPS